MVKKRRYIVVTERYLPELQERVEELLYRGWELVGGLTVDNSYNYYQALSRVCLILKDNEE